MAKDYEIVWGLGLTIFSFAMLLFVFQRAKAGRVPKIRRLEAMDGIDEAVGSCAEMGRPVALQIGGGVTGSSSHAAAAAMCVFTHAARMCARMGARPQVPTSAGGEVNQLYMMALESAYEVEGQGEAYSSDMVQQISTGGEYSTNIALASFLQRENVGATIWLGEFALIQGIVIDVDGICVLGGTNLSNVTAMVMLSDYVFIGEELYVAGAMISGEKLAISSIMVMDTLKFIFLGVIATALSHVLIYGKMWAWK